MLVEKELRTRYVHTFLGPIWIVANPLVPALLFTFVFTKVVPVETKGVGYFSLVTAALAPWATVNRSLMRGGNCLIAERQLLTKVYLPRLLLPLTVVSTAIIDLVASILVAMGSLYMGGGTVGVRILWLPVLVVWTLAIALGLILVLSGSSVYRRDVLYALPMLIQVWLYLTPVMYPASAMPQSIRRLLWLNPLAPIAQCYQWVITGSEVVVVNHVLLSVAMTGMLLVIGLFVFAKGSSVVADAV